VDTIKCLGHTNNTPLLFVKYQVGEKVKIIYNVNDRNINRIDDFMSSYFPFTACSIVTLFLLFIARKYRSK